ncbi:MAG: hypothetical protein ACTSR2_00880 [Candidatus Hodarchaeales archaeon]
MSSMICPYCKKEVGRMFVQKENCEEEIRCPYCGELLQTTEIERKKDQPTLKCPRCGNYSRNDYCSHCGYEFKEGIDY